MLRCCGGLLEFGDGARDALFKYGGGTVVARQAERAHLGLREVLILPRDVGRSVDELEVARPAERGKDGVGQVQKRPRLSSRRVVQSVVSAMSPEPEKMVDAIADEDEIAAL